MPVALHPQTLLRRAFAVCLALFWAWSVGESALHALESQHVVCDEHGVIEDLATSPLHAHDAPVLSAAPASDDDGHAACAHGVAVRGTTLTLSPAQPALFAPALPLVDARPAAPVLLSDAPRGPPLLALAAKTSPPRVA